MGIIEDKITINSTKQNTLQEKNYTFEKLNFNFQFVLYVIKNVVLIFVLTFVRRKCVNVPINAAIVV